MGASLEDTENRIVLITDAEPNTGDFTTEGLAARLKANAADGIFTTIVGVGLDFNTELIDAISRVKGLNYYSVHTPGAHRDAPHKTRRAVPPPEAPGCPCTHC